MKKIADSIIPATIWLLVTIYLLTLPGTRLPKEDWLDKIWMDKWVHVFLFVILVWLWCKGLQLKTRQRFLIICFAAILYGIAMEFVQKYFVIYRSFDFGDIIADSVGSVTGLLISLRRYIKK